MIYQEGGRGFMLIHRTPAGATAIKQLVETDQAKAATKARSFLAEHLGHAMLNTYDQDRENYNQRESDNLMNIVAVSYGVALTAALGNRPDLLLHPVSTPHLILSLALLAAGLLTAFTFYTYVLSVGGDKPYDVTWTMQSSKPMGILRFFADLVLASLYVHLLFAAVHVDTGPNTAPKLAGFVLAFIPVFAGAIVVRLFRGRGIHWVAVGAAGGTLLFWAFARHRIMTRDFDLLLEALLLVAILGYGVLNHLIPYEAWKRDPSASAPPRP
jgi:hypothetical protein